MLDLPNVSQWTLHCLQSTSSICQEPLYYHYIGDNCLYYRLQHPIYRPLIGMYGYNMQEGQNLTCQYLYAKYLQNIMIYPNKKNHQNGWIISNENIMISVDIITKCLKTCCSWFICHASYWYRFCDNSTPLNSNSNQSLVLLPVHKDKYTTYILS